MFHWFDRLSFAFATRTGRHSRIIATFPKGLVSDPATAQLGPEEVSGRTPTKKDFGSDTLIVFDGVCVANRSAFRGSPLASNLFQSLSKYLLTLQLYFNTC
jgi:hypothetical protein